MVSVLLRQSGGSIKLIFDAISPTYAEKTLVVLSLNLRKSFLIAKHISRAFSYNSKFFHWKIQRVLCTAYGLRLYVFHFLL